MYPCLVGKLNDYKGLSKVTTYNHTTKVKMKNENLIKHLASVDLSFLKVVKDEVVEVFKTEQIEYSIKPKNWSNDIAELENYFTNIELPTGPVKLNKYSTITDCSLFVESHFATVKGNNLSAGQAGGNRTFLPYLNRLQELKNKLSKID